MRRPSSNSGADQCAGRIVRRAGWRRAGAGREAPAQQEQARPVSAILRAVTAPEVGAGRGALNAPPPVTSEPQAPSGGERRRRRCNRAAADDAVARIEAPIPFSGRGGSPAQEQELEAALRNGVIAGASASEPVGRVADPTRWARLREFATSSLRSRGWWWWP
jgi:hypothetical protein